MRNFILILFATSSIQLLAQSSLNVDLFTQFHRGDTRYSGCWSYVAPDSSEYALLGTTSGTAIYAIDDQNEIEEVGFIPGGVSNWREITVVGDYAYISTESNATGVGMQVIDLTQLPDTASLLTTYDETFTRGHIIQKDIFSDAPFVYMIGTTSTDGVHILDVSNPAAPIEVGLYQPDYYIHDCYVREHIMFAAAFFEGTMDVVDISDKSNPVVLARIPTPGGRTHSSSLSMDGKYLFIAPEQDGLIGTIWNIEDLENPDLVSTYTANLESLVHNPYVLGDFAFVSHNTEGLRVVDFADPELPVEVGFYDTFEGPSGGFSGLWSACPYLPSGKIIGGNRENGLYVWTFNGTRAARLYGLVVDANEFEPIFNATIFIQETGDELNSDFEGSFKFGHLEGDYTITVFAEGYESQTVNISLLEGDREEIVIALNPEAVTSTQNKKIKNLKVFPNPFHEILTIDLGGNRLEGQINLINNAGKIIRQIPLNPSDTILKLNRLGLASGNYWLEFRNKTNQLMDRRAVQIQ